MLGLNWPLHSTDGVCTQVAEAASPEVRLSPARRHPCLWPWNCPSDRPVPPVLGASLQPRWAGHMKGLRAPDMQFQAVPAVATALSPTRLPGPETFTSFKVT